jgi:hypothetical protein
MKRKCITNIKNITAMFFTSGRKYKIYFLKGVRMFEPSNFLQDIVSKKADAWSLCIDEQSFEELRDQ